MTDTPIANFDDESLARKLVAFIMARRATAARLGPLINPLVERIRASIADDVAGLSDDEIIGALLDVYLASGSPLPTLEC